MKLVIVVAALLLTGCQSKTDQKLDSIIERLDSLEGKLSDQADEVEKVSSDIDELKTEIQNIDCGN